MKLLRLNQVQRDIQPEEIAFVEGRKIAKDKNSNRRASDSYKATVPADEEYFEEILIQQLKGGDHDNDQEKENDDSDDDDEASFQEGEFQVDVLSSVNESSKFDSLHDHGEDQHNNNRSGFDKILNGKAGMEFLGDVRCCLFLVLIVAATSLAVGIYAVTLNEQKRDFNVEVCIFRRMVVCAFLFLFT
jgi:hypothetical protein